MTIIDQQPEPKPAEPKPSVGVRTIGYGCALLIVSPFLGGLALMLLLGMLHDYHPAVPAPGYWWSFWTLFLARYVVGALRGNGSKAFVDLLKSTIPGVKAAGGK